MSETEHRPDAFDGEIDALRAYFTAHTNALNAIKGDQFAQAMAKANEARIYLESINPGAQA